MGRRLLFPLLPVVLRSFHDFVEGLRSRMASEQLPSTASVPAVSAFDLLGLRGSGFGVADGLPVLGPKLE